MIEGYQSVCRARLEQVYNEEVRDLLAPGGSARPLEVSALAAGALPAGDALGVKGLAVPMLLSLSSFITMLRTGAGCLA